MSKRTASSAASNNGRVQQRPRYLPPNQTDVPEIPGVPPNVTPLLVISLKSATKFFAATTTPQNPFVEDHDDTTTLSASVVDSILSRMDSTEEKTALKKKKDRMKEDSQSWLNGVKRHAKDCHKGSSSTVPTCCFRYLWGLQQEHSRVAARRASLHLCGLLLQRSSECRIFTASDQVLLDYVTSVVEPKNIKASSSSDVQVSCWQAESLLWLTFLSDSFGDLYPKFRVAQRFLEQRAPIDSNILSEGNGGANMADLRRIRDIAMKYGDREVAKVDKLIQRAHKYLDVLVPRMGVSTAEDSETVAVAATVASAASDLKEGTDDINGDGSDDDDEIDWEDGDEEFDESADIEAHADAVERTLAQMAANAGGLQGGHIEINLGSKQDEEESPNDLMDENTRRLLQKTVQSIESRHMKRLSSWVDALVKSDGLVLNEGKSLVVMSTDVAKKRSDLLHNLLERKQTLASILASAAKLGISVDSHKIGSQAVQQAAAATTNVPPPRQCAVLATAARRRNDTKVARRKSNKLQIKYRTS